MSQDKHNKMSNKNDYRTKQNKLKKKKFSDSDDNNYSSDNSSDGEINIHEFRNQQQKLFNLLSILISLIFIFINFVLLISNYYFNTPYSFFLSVYIIIISYKEFFKKLRIQEGKSFFNLISHFLFYFITITYLFLKKDFLNDVNDFFIILVLIELFLLIIYLLKYNKFIYNFNFSSGIKIIFFLKKRFLPVLGNSFIRSVDGIYIVYIITFFLNFEVLGIFKIFTSILGVIHIFLQVLENIYPYKFSLIFKESKKKFKRLFLTNLFLIFILLLCVCFLINLYINELVQLLFFIEIKNYLLLFYILSFAICFEVFNIFSGYLLRILNRTPSFIFFILFDIFILFLCPILIKLYDLDGLIIFFLFYSIQRFFISLYFLFINLNKVESSF